MYVVHNADQFAKCLTEIRRRKRTTYLLNEVVISGDLWWFMCVQTSFACEIKTPEILCMLVSFQYSRSTFRMMSVLKLNHRMSKRWSLQTTEYLFVSNFITVVHLISNWYWHENNAHIKPLALIKLSNLRKQKHWKKKTKRPRLRRTDKMKMYVNQIMTLIKSLYVFFRSQSGWREEAVNFLLRFGM